MIWYHLIFSDNKKAVGYAWNLMGFVAKLAQGVSHLDFYLYILGTFSFKIIFLLIQLGLRMSSFPLEKLSQND